MTGTGSVQTVVLRVAALAILLLLVLVSAISVRTLGRLPNTVIYFVHSDANGASLEPVYRRSRTRSDEAFVRAAVRALADGPDPEERSRGLSSEIPAEVEVLDVRFEGERLYLDLSANFEQGGGTAAMEGRLNQLLYTVTQPSTISEVMLSIGGREVTVFSGEGLLVDRPWRRSDHATVPSW